MPLALVLVLALNLAGGTARAADEDATAAVRAQINRALEVARTGSTTRWSAPSGRDGTVEITRTFYRDDGTPCRDYIVTVTRGPERGRSEGTGCRTGPGGWGLSVVLPPRPRPQRGAERASPAADVGAPAPAAQPGSRVADRPDIDLSGFRPVPAQRKPLIIKASLPVPSQE